MKNIFLLFGLFFAGLSYSQDELSIIAVGEAGVVQEKLIILPPKSSNTPLAVAEKIHANNVFEIILNDFAFYKKKFELKKYDLNDYKGEVGAPNFDHWKEKKANWLVHLDVKKEQANFDFKASVFNAVTKQKIGEFSKQINEPLDRHKVHELADSIYTSITGKKSIFTSHIVFVSNKGSTDSVMIKELYKMDFDGNNVKKLTNHRGIVISPAISNDGKKIVYSLIRYVKGQKKNVNLYLYDEEAKTSTILSNRPGINSGAVFHPSGESIFLTLSHVGNSEIFEMNLTTKALRRVTRHPADDVDPSLNHDGSLITYLSSRPGKAMIYVGQAQGTEQNVRRISFVGRFNATPRFNPEGTEIAFSSWVDNRFDLYRINVKGTELVRLTKNFGSNESPSYSLDGQFIVFNSLRVITGTKAVQDLYIMDRDGEIITQLTKDFGNCLSPRWSK